MQKGNWPGFLATAVLAVLFFSFSGCGGGSGGNGGGGGGGGNPPATPTGIVATPGNGQIALKWTASSGATSYTVRRSTTSGGPYSSLANPSAASYADTAVTNGIAYYYVVAASKMVMLPWVAQSPENAGANGNLHWTFSVSQDGACASKVDQWNSDAGINLKSDCITPMVASKAQLSRAYYPLLDGPPQSGDPANAVYRNQWVTDPNKGLAQAFGSGPTCPIPYSNLTSCHFYDMDNEIDIWNGTHVDIHPNPAGYDELRDTFLLEARNLKAWDPAAVRLGPVSCCWWFYWNGANGNDKSAHGGVDFLPYWVNEIYWRDQIAGSRSLDLFDIHAYPDGPDTSGWANAQKQAATRVYRDYWDPTYTTESGYNGNPYVTSTQPRPSIIFRIPRMPAIVNSTYPGTPLAFTEWSAGYAGESDFSTALGDADSYGILGRERVGLASRWGAPDPANPNYQALKLYANYDGAHHTFNPISVSATHNADPDLVSIYAATNASGNSLTMMVLNKDPNNAAQASFIFNGFSPSQVATYTLSQGSPNSIVPGTATAWSSKMTFQPYTATLLVISGSGNVPAAEWDLNPDTAMVPAGGTVTIHPKLVSGSANLTISVGTSDSGITPTITGSAMNGTTQGSVQITAGNTPGFYHFNVQASDATTQGGWIVVRNPAVSLAKTAGDNQSAPAGSVLPANLSVTLTPGQSGGSAGGASVFFTTTAGSLQNVQIGSEAVFSGPKVIAVTNSSGVASVKLTLPGTSDTQVQVTAEGPYALGHATVTFTETAQ